MILPSLISRRIQTCILVLLCMQFDMPLDKKV
jgi:hypothetical protein